MTTLSTGGFANTDASLGAYDRTVEYVATVFMILAALALRALRADRSPGTLDAAVASTRRCAPSSGTLGT